MTYQIVTSIIAVRITKTGLPFTEVITMEDSCTEIIRLAEKVMDGGEITEEEAKRLIRTKDEDTMLLLAMADKIRQKFNGNAVDFCAILNARSGHCQENCKFCAQSGWYQTGSKVYRLLPEEEIPQACSRASVVLNPVGCLLRLVPR